MKRFNKSQVLAGLFGIVALVGVLLAGDTGFHSIKLKDGTIKDGDGTTRITVGSTNAITGNATISGTLTTSGTSYFTIQQSTAPRDSSALIGITPTAAGQLVYNSTDRELCMSTGTTRFTWVRTSSTSVTACQH